MGKDESFGLKMQKLMNSKKMGIEQLAKETGYSKKYLEQIKNDEVVAPVSVILSISQALSVASEDILVPQKDISQKRQNTKKRNEGLKKRAENYSYELLTTQGKNKHLNAFRVTIEPHQDHKMVAYHHPGEEFIYVLSGKLELQVGRKIHNLGEGEFMHFDSSKHHRLKSISEIPTVIIVTVYSP